MKNVLILGCARSGTSMLAEAFSRAGYFLGPDLMPGREGNPHGYFESRVIESLNEDLFDQVLPSRPQGRGARFLHLFHRHIPDRPRRWLAGFEAPPDFHPDPRIDAAIRELADRQPFCFKDPRFVYTWAYWRRVLPSHKLICVFRDPSETVASMRLEMKRLGHDRHVRISDRGLLRTWERAYRSVLRMASPRECLFIHRDDLLGAEGRHAVESFVEKRLDWSGVDPALDHARAVNQRVATKAEHCYAELRALAQGDVDRVDGKRSDGT